MRRRISLKTVMIANFVVVILLFILFSVLNLRYKKEVDRQTQEISCNNRQVTNLSQMITDGQKHLNAYIRSYGEVDRGEFDSCSQEIFRILDEMEPVFSSDRELLLYSRVLFQINTSQKDFLKTYFVDPSPQNAAFENIQYMADISSEMNKNFYELSNSYIKVSNRALETMQKNYTGFYYKQVFTILAIFIMYAVFFAFFVRDILKTLDEVTDVANELSAKNWYTENIGQGHYKELNTVVAAFNQMRSEIINYLEKLKNQIQMERLLHDQEMRVAHQKEMINESRYQMLQMQINPHFIFNTLNLIIRVIQCGENDTAALLVKSTSDLLRSSIEIKESCIPLSRELQLLESYLIILRERMDGRIEFVMEMGEIDTEVKIPPFTIQPLVENSIKHGMAKVTRGGVVTILLEQHPGYIEIMVTDNGTGCDQQLFDDILTGKSDAGVGIRNIQERLQLLYRREDVIEITSSVMEGTSVKVKIWEGIG